MPHYDTGGKANKDLPPVLLNLEAEEDPAEEKEEQI